MAKTVFRRTFQRAYLARRPFPFTSGGAAPSVLSQITLDADGTIAAEVTNDDASGAPFFSHGNQAPDGGSATWFGNDATETTTTAWMSLEDLDADFESMLTLNMDVDVQITAPGNDTLTLVAQIFDADNCETDYFLLSIAEFIM